jgi:tetratricopeptide (TPR) repeat protein
METLGDWDESKRLNERALEVSRRLGDSAGLAVSLGNLAEAAGRAGDIEGARERFADAVAASRALRSAHRLVEQYWQVGFFELSVGHPERARTAFQQAQAQAEDGGMDEYAATGRAFLAFCEAELGDDHAGERFTTDAQRMFENPNLRAFTFVRQIMLVIRAALDARQGNLVKAATALGALAAIEDTGSTLNWTLEGRRAQVLEVVEAGLDRSELAAAMEAGRRLGLDDVIALITSD